VLDLVQQRIVDEKGVLPDPSLVGLIPHALGLGREFDRERHVNVSLAQSALRVVMR
jgi:hypothetical protein